MTVREAINNRYSARYYKKEKISKEKLDLILEAGCKAPSGIATEPWKFILLQGDMTKLGDATYNQQHVKDAAAVIVLVNYTSKLIEDSPNIMLDKFKLAGFPKEKQENYYNILKSSKGTKYFREQLMFAGAQMCLQATELGVGSCIIGGFEESKVSDILGLNKEYYEVGLMITLGIASKELDKKRINRPKEDVVSYVNI